jgi:hypothetical protein
MDGVRDQKEKKARVKKTSMTMRPPREYVPNFLHFDTFSEKKSRLDPRKF